MDLETERTRLYGLPLEQFTAQRNALARELRADGRRQEAAAVAALPKPTLAAWVVNILARTQRREIDLLLDSGKRLYDAQQASLEKGGRAGLDEARERLETATARATDAAREVLGERTSTQLLDRVAETLRTAALTPEGRELLATGMLVKEMTTTGWELVTAIGGTQTVEQKPRRGREPQETAGDRAARQEELARAREALSLAKEHRSELRRRLRDAEREVAERREALEQAERSRDDAKRELAAAEEAEAAAGAAVREIAAASKRRRRA